MLCRSLSCRSYSVRPLLAQIGVPPRRSGAQVSCGTVCPDHSPPLRPGTCYCFLPESVCRRLATAIARSQSGLYSTDLSSLYGRLAPVLPPNDGLVLSEGADSALCKLSSGLGITL